MGRGGEDVNRATKDDGSEEGWYDDDGFWFEPSADGSEGFYDCYDPEGVMYETGSYTDDGEWIKADGEYDAHGKWAPTDTDPFALPGMMASSGSAAAASSPQVGGTMKEPPPPRAAGLVLETNEDGEQGYFYKGRWICVGWYDADEFWFEEAGDVNESGEFVANGFHDCYDDSGDWAETGYWGDDDGWHKVHGYYDDDGVWVDEEPPPEEKPKPTPKPTSKGGKKKIEFIEESDSGEESDSEEEEEVYRGEMHLGKGGKKGKGGKYAPEKNAMKKQTSRDSEPDKTINGEQILICDMAGATYNDVPWAVMFLLMVFATAGLAVYKNFLGGTTMDVAAYCDSNPCENGGTCKELNVAVNGHVGYQCMCAAGWLGDTCDVAPCATCAGGANGT